MITGAGLGGSGGLAATGCAEALATAAEGAECVGASLATGALVDIAGAGASATLEAEAVAVTDVEGVDASALSR